MISLVKLYEQIVKEYGNKGPSIPVVYSIDKNGEYKEINISELPKISNMIYDMGGGETSYSSEYNVVVIDNMDVDEFINNLDNYDRIYIQYNLNNPFTFPKVNEIILSQVVYHISNVEILAETVNNSLKSNGKIEFFSDLMNKKDKIFIKTLIDKYGFFINDNIQFEKISQYKSQTLILTKDKPFISPPEIYKYEIENIKTKEKGYLQYERNKQRHWVETVHGDIDPNDFYDKGKPLAWASHVIDKDEPYPPFVHSPEYKKNEWYIKEYPLRFKYKFIKKL